MAKSSVRMHNGAVRLNSVIIGSSASFIIVLLLVNKREKMKENTFRNIFLKAIL